MNKFRIIVVVRFCSVVDVPVWSDSVGFSTSQWRRWTRWTMWARIKHHCVLVKRDGAEVMEMSVFLVLMQKDALNPKKTMTWILQHKLEKKSYPINVTRNFIESFRFGFSLPPHSIIIQRLLLIVNANQMPKIIRNNFEIFNVTYLVQSNYQSEWS